MGIQHALPQHDGVMQGDVFERRATRLMVEDHKPAVGGLAGRYSEGDVKRYLQLGSPLTAHRVVPKAQSMANPTQDEARVEVDTGSRVRPPRSTSDCSERPRRVTNPVVHRSGVGISIQVGAH